jgi:methyl-accepting chemotaxis protein
MKNMKIKMKLIAGFLIVAITTTLVGIIGIWGLYQMDAEADLIYGESTIAIDHLGNIRANFEKQRIEMRETAICAGPEGDPAEREQSKGVIKDLESAIMEEFAGFEATLTDQGREQEYFDAKTRYLSDFAKLKSDLISMSETGAVQDVWAVILNASSASADIEANFDKSSKNNLSRAGDAIANADKTFSLSRLIQIIGMIFAILVAIGLGFLISGMISKPTAHLVEVAEALTKGDIDIHIETHSHDEIGVLSDAFNSLADSIKEQEQVLELIAEGDYQTSIRVRSEKDVMNRCINTVLEKNNKLFQEVKEAASQVSSGAGQIAMGAQSLASGSTEQAATLQQFSASIADVLSQSEENTSKSKEAYEDVQKSSKYMVESMESMSNMTVAMRDINESSGNIAKVIKVIDDIAFQTNILALNAAVEAARAGQHGKGFAVVADEVRNLASKSAEAAKETAALIENSTQKVSEGNNIAKKTSESLMSVNEISERNALAMQEISSASHRQSESISEITRGISQISDVVQANSATAEQSSAAAQQLSAQASMLENILSQFKLRSGSMLGSISDSMAISGSSSYGDAPYQNTYADQGSIGGLGGFGRTPAIDLGGFDKY